MRANYTGADAQTIEQSVAAPIEQQMSGVDKSNYIQSVNANGSIRMTINFDVATDPNVDHILAQMRVNQASSQLPQDVVNAGVTVQKIDERAVTSRRLEFAEGHLQQRLPRKLRQHQPHLRSHAFPAFRTSRFSALANTRCGFG